MLAMKLQEIFFRKIQMGQKTVEMRLYDEKRQKLRVGEMLYFTNMDNNQEMLAVLVTALHHFPDFDHLYQQIPLDKLGYSEDELNTASADDMLAFYSKDMQKHYGVVGIEFILL